MFKSLYSFFLNYTDKPSVLFKINIFFYKGMNVFRFKCARSIAWFSVVFDKLTLNRVYVANKKWDWSYIVLRTWFLIFYLLLSIFLITLILA